MSVNSLFVPGGRTIDTQFLPGFVSSDVKNPMVIDLDAANYSITDAGALVATAVNGVAVNLVADNSGSGAVNATLAYSAPNVTLNKPLSMGANALTAGAVTAGAINAASVSTTGAVTAGTTLAVTGASTLANTAITGTLTASTSITAGTVAGTGTADVYCNTLHYANLNPAPLGAVPIGSVHQYAGSAAPSGFLLCDGTSYSTTTYAGLFAVVGYTFGGSGANFNVPDMRGRFPIGTSATYVLGATGGSSTHTLDPDELPKHTHPINDPGHSHTYDTKNTTSSYTIAGSTYWKDDTSATTSTSTTGITVLDNVTSELPFSILNPYLSMPYIIKT